MSRVSLFLTSAGIVALLALLVFLFFSLIPKPTMRCVDISERDFARKLEIIDAATREADPTADAAPDTFVIRFQFDLDPAWAGDGRFVITSQRTWRSIYNGRYQPVIPVLVDPELSQEDEGWDNLQIEFFRFEPRLWCSWFTEPGHQFWARPGTVRMRLMVHRWIDSDGLHNEYQVQLP